MNRAEKRQAIKKVDDTIGRIKAINHELKKGVTELREKTLKRSLYANHKILVEMGLYVEPSLWSKLKAKIKGKFKR